MAREGKGEEELVLVYARLACPQLAGAAIRTARRARCRSGPQTRAVSLSKVRAVSPQFLSYSPSSRESLGIKHRAEDNAISSHRLRHRVAQRHQLRGRRGESSGR